MSEIDASGLTRRDVIKRSVVVGGLIWIAPTILASPAGASVHPCPNCTGRVFGIRHDVNSTAGCTTPGSSPSNPDNCGVQPDPDYGGDVGTFEPGCCLVTAGLVGFSESADKQTHTYTYPPGVRICGGAFGRCAGGVCVSQHDAEVTEFFEDPSDSARVTRVEITCVGLTHSETYVCVEGTAPPGNC